MTHHEKMTDGANDRSREAPIGQTAGGLPDDSSRLPQPSEAEEEAVRRAVSPGRQPGDKTPHDRLMEEVDEQVAASERGSE